MNKLAQKYLHGQGVRQDCVTGMACPSEIPTGVPIWPFGMK